MDEGCRFKRLRNACGRTRLCRCVLVERIECPDEKDDRRPVQSRMISNIAANLISVLALHIDVCQYDAGSNFVECLDRRITVVDLDDMEIPIGEGLRHQTSNRGTIVRYQDRSLHNSRT